MKLTKEECMKSLKFLYDEASVEYDVDDDGELICYDRTQHDKYLNPYFMLEQLINEHFESSECRVESSLTRDKNLVSNLVSEIDKLEKALDKACEKLATVIEIEDCNGFCEHMPPYKNCMCNTKEFWKEYLLNER